MRGPEKQITADYVTTGQVRLMFSPILDHGPGGLLATAAAYCMGQQDPAAFWTAHDTFFENQGQIFRADEGDYGDLAEQFGLDRDALAACLANGDGHAWATEKDSARRQAEIYLRPTIDINGIRLFGAQSYETYREVIESLLP